MVSTRGDRVKKGEPPLPPAPPPPNSARKCSRKKAGPKGEDEKGTEQSQPDQKSDEQVQRHQNSTNQESHITTRRSNRSTKSKYRRVGTAISVSFADKFEAKEFYKDKPTALVKATTLRTVDPLLSVKASVPPVNEGDEHDENSESEQRGLTRPEENMRQPSSKTKTNEDAKSQTNDDKHNTSTEDPANGEANSNSNTIHEDASSEVNDSNKQGGSTSEDEQHSSGEEDSVTDPVPPKRFHSNGAEPSKCDLSDDSSSGEDASAAKAKTANVEVVSSGDESISSKANKEPPVDDDCSDEGIYDPLVDQIRKSSTSSKANQILSPTAEETPPVAKKLFVESVLSDDDASPPIQANKASLLRTPEESPSNAKQPSVKVVDSGSHDSPPPQANQKKASLKPPPTSTPSLLKPNQKSPFAVGASPISSVEDDAVSPSSRPLITFPFDGLQLQNVVDLEKRLTTNSFKHAIALGRRKKHLNKSLREAPIYSKDQNSLLRHDALSDSMFCFARNWMCRYGYPDRVLWLEPYFWWQLTNPGQRNDLVERWARKFDVLTKVFVIVIPIIGSGHVSTAIVVAPSVAFYGPQTEDEYTRLLHVDSWHDDTYHKTDTILEQLVAFLQDVRCQKASESESRCPLVSRDEMRGFIDHRHGRCENGELLGHDGLVESHLLMINVSVTIQAKGSLNCLLHTLHNSLVLIKLVEKLDYTKLNATSFEAEWVACKATSFGSKRVAAFRNDLAELPKLLGALRKKRLEKVEAPTVSRATTSEKPTSRKLDLLPKAGGSRERDTNSEKSPDMFRVQNDQGRSAQKSRRRNADEALRPLRNNSNKSRRKNGERPQHAPQQVDERMRRQLIAAAKKTHLAQTMSTPFTKSDDFGKLCEDWTVHEKRQSAEEAQMPNTIVGMFMLTEQKPNACNSSSVFCRDLFRDRPKLAFLMPSKHQSEKFFEEYKRGEYDLEVVFDPEEFMHVVQQPDIVRKKEPNQPKSPSVVEAELSAGDGLKYGGKNKHTP